MICICSHILIAGCNMNLIDVISGLLGNLSVNVSYICQTFNLARFLCAACNSNMMCRFRVYVMYGYILLGRMCLIDNNVGLFGSLSRNVLKL